MTHRAIPIIAFHGYIIICLCHLREYVLYTYMWLTKLCHSGNLGQLMDMVRKRTCVEATVQQEDLERFRKIVKLELILTRYIEKKYPYNCFVVSSIQ